MNSKEIGAEQRAQVDLGQLGDALDRVGGEAAGEPVVGAQAAGQQVDGGWRTGAEGK